MSKIIVDQVQKLTGGTAAFNIPSADGTAGQFLKTDGSRNLGWSSMTNPNTDTYTGIPVLEGKGIIGSIVTHSDRENTYSTGEWTGTGPWTTFVNWDLTNNTYAVQFMNMVLGDGEANRTDTTTEYMYGSDSEHQFARTLQFAHGKRMGYARDFFHYDNATGTPGASWRIMPVRNTTGSPVTVSLAGCASDYWSNGYEGSCIVVYEPNTTLYSTVTSVTATNIANTQNNSQSNSLTGTYTIPAGKTVLVCLASTDQYQTTYRFKDTNFFYNLDTTFTNPGVICDMRMLYNLHNSRFTDMNYTGTIASNFPTIWKTCATNYGDR